MAECKDLQALGKISSEVDDSKVKIILSSQCIKAQIFLVDRLRKESERQKEIYKYLSSGNLKLEAEIKHAEQELRSLMTAYETQKMSNVDLKKEFLLAKERKSETSERVKTGESKYEQLWLQCKKRYESIPLVQKWFECTNRTETVKERIRFLQKETETLTQEINNKRYSVEAEDKKRIIAMATFLVHERPKQVQEIREKIMKVEKLSTEIDEYNKEQAAKRDASILRELPKPGNHIMLVDSDWPSLCDSLNNKDSLGMPILQLARNEGIDILNVNLEQIKRDVAPPHKTKSQEQRTSENENQKENCYTLSFFNKSYLPQDNDNTVAAEEGTKKFARKKLINILEDIAVNTQEAENMLSTIDPHEMKEVTEIGANVEKNHNETAATDPTTELTMECEEIEEIDMSAGANNIVIPPTQFMDFSQDRGNVIFEQEVMVTIHGSRDEPSPSLQLKSSQDGSQKKRVVFDLPPIQEVPEETASGDHAKTNDDEELNSQMNASGLSDDSFIKIKEMILKKHNLDLSPDFVYAKKLAQSNNESPTVTSKFFKHTDLENKTVRPDEKIETVEELDTQKTQERTSQTNNNNSSGVSVKENAAGLTDLSAKNKEVDKTVSGFLFTHGPHGIPDSLDISISTTGFEDGDGEFPHCIDSSLLLSPKADFPIPVSGSNNDVYSQEVPNFLSGLRKTGLSFFGKSEGSQPDSSAPKDGNNFNFNFNRDGDKKSRGGMFSMFQ